MKKVMENPNCPICKGNGNFNEHLVLYAIYKMSKERKTYPELKVKNDDEIEHYINENKLYKLKFSELHLLLLPVIFPWPIHKQKMGISK